MPNRLYEVVASPLPSALYPYQSMERISCLELPLWVEPLMQAEHFTRGCLNDAGVAFLADLLPRAK